MSAAPSTISTAPSLRQLGLALGAVLIAIAVVAALALARPAAIKTPTEVAPATAQFDHGTAEWKTKALTVSGTRGGGINYTGIPYATGDRGLTVSGTHGGGILYTGIPYSTPDSTPVHGGRGTRIAK